MHHKTILEVSITKAHSGREEGIRTLGELPHTRVPGVLLRPLGHLSKIKNYNLFFLNL